MNEILAWRRLGLLLRNDIVGGYRTLLTHSATLAALIVGGSALNAAFNGTSGFDASFWWFSGLLFIWGSIMASLAFSELHDKTKNDSYLLLPASALEKTIARLFLVTVGFFVYLLVYATVVSLLAKTVNVLLFGLQQEMFRPFDPIVWVLVGHYIVSQSLFFLGAAWFRKAHFWKTSLAIAVICFGFIAFAGLLSWILFEPYRDGFGVSFGERELYNVYLGRMPLVGWAVEACKIAYFFVLPPFCWFVAWLRVKETQVSHGV